MGTFGVIAVGAIAVVFGVLQGIFETAVPGDSSSAGTGSLAPPDQDPPDPSELEMATDSGSEFPEIDRA